MRAKRTELLARFSRHMHYPSRVLLPFVKGRKNQAWGAFFVFFYACVVVTWKGDLGTLLLVGAPTTMLAALVMRMAVTFFLETFPPVATALAAFAVYLASAAVWVLLVTGALLAALGVVNAFASR